MMKKKYLIGVFVLGSTLLYSCGGNEPKTDSTENSTTLKTEEVSEDIVKELEEVNLSSEEIKNEVDDVAHEVDDILNDLDK